MDNIHCKNKIVKITNSLVSTVARNNGNCNLISRVGCYDCMVTYNVHTLILTNYNPIIAVSISLYGLIDLQRSKINILIRFPNLLCADIRHDI